MTLIKGLLFTFALISTASAQLVPPVAQTNIVRLSPNTQIRWNANPVSEQIHGYLVKAQQNANVWSNYVASTNILLTTLAPSIQQGPATINVTAYSTQGVTSDPSTVSTNLAQVPSPVRGIEITTIIVVNP